MHVYMCDYAILAGALPVYAQHAWTLELRNCRSYNVSTT